MTSFFTDHLNLDSVVAFVDGELSLTAFQRAAAHVSSCPMCASEVNEQASARESLRSAGAPPMPTSLAAALRSIPVAVPAPTSTPGIDFDIATGHAIRVSHLTRDVTMGRRFRLGAGALVAGIAVGAFASAGSAGDPGQGPTGGSTVRPASFAPQPHTQPHTQPNLDPGSR